MVLANGRYKRFFKEKIKNLKLDKAMDIARTREATVNNMKTLEHQGTRNTNIDGISIGNRMGPSKIKD